MTYQIAATTLTVNDLEGHSQVTGIFKCNPSNICAAFYTISTDSVLARFLCISRASCLSGYPHFCQKHFYDVVFIQIAFVNFAHFSVCQRCSVAQKYVKNAFLVEVRPGSTPLGISRRFPRPANRVWRGHPLRSPPPQRLWRFNLCAQLGQVLLCSSAKALCVYLIFVHD